MWRAAFASLLLSACATSSVGAKAAPVRGFSRGWTTYHEYLPFNGKRDTTLTAAGSAVTVAVETPDCPQVGYVTGIAGRDEIDEPVESMLEEATHDARNRAAGHGDTFVIDATETWWDDLKNIGQTDPPIGEIVMWAAVHGRLFRC
jgi:hypothetical protein